MSYIKILVHCVWTTKNRTPLLTDSIREKIIFHICENANKKGIYIDHINGYYEHIHALISMGGKQNISNIIQMIKGECSFWINKNKLINGRFEWQDDFYCGSIGMPQLEIIRKYIRNQFEHHKKNTFRDELERMIEEYLLEKKLD
jgi:REP element-mobilizing transposase RayT